VRAILLVVYPRQNAFKKAWMCFSREAVVVKVEKVY
jgi:hypothetical protein